MSLGSHTFRGRAEIKYSHVVLNRVYVFFTKMLKSENGSIKSVINIVFYAVLFTQIVYD